MKFLGELAEEVHNRLEKTHSKGKSIALKLKVRREDAPVETAKFLGRRGSTNCLNFGLVRRGSDTFGVGGAVVSSVVKIFDQS